MRKQRKEEIRKIEDALIRSFRRSDGDAGESGGPYWTQRVMARVREESQRGKILFGNGVEIPKTIWRFAAATCLMALLMAAYVVRFDSATRTEVAELSLLDAATDISPNFMEVL